MKIDKYVKREYRQTEEISDSDLYETPPELTESIQYWLDCADIEASKREDVQNYINSILSRVLNSINEEDYEFLNEDIFCGEEAAYWHKQYSDLMQAKELLDRKSRTDSKTNASLHKTMKASRDNWKKKYKDAVGVLNKLQMKSYSGEFWPKFEDTAEIVKLGDRVKVSLQSEDGDVSTEIGELTSVRFEYYPISGIVTYLDIDGVQYELGTGCHISSPGPDTMHSILQDAVKYGRDLADYSSESVQSEEMDKLMKRIENVIITDSENED